MVGNAGGLGTLAFPLKDLAASGLLMAEAKASGTARSISRDSLEGRDANSKKRCVGNAAGIPPLCGALMFWRANEGCLVGENFAVGQHTSRWPSGWRWPCCSHVPLPQVAKCPLQEPRNACFPVECGNWRACIRPHDNKSPIRPYRRKGLHGRIADSAV